MKTTTLKTAGSMIKKLFIGISIALLIGWNLNCFGQDTIIKNNGIKISVKVLEISSSEVRYRKSENPDGPVYIESVRDMSFIKYSTGIADTFKFEKPWLIQVPAKAEEKAIQAKKEYQQLQKLGGHYLFGNSTIIREKDMHNYLLTLNDPAITNHVKAAKRQKGLQYIGFAAIPLGVLGLISFWEESQMFSYQRDTEGQSHSVSTVLAIGGIACIGASISFKINRKRNNETALKLYEQKF
jgi:hypothetical protein